MGILLFFLLLPCAAAAELSDWLYVKSGVTVVNPDIWRGIDLPLNHSPAILPALEAELPSVGLAAQVEGNFALIGRGSEEDRVEMTDQVKGRLWGDYFLFNDKSLEVMAGITLYRNLYWSIERYGSATLEPFVQLRLPTVFLKPAFEIYVDLTPAQTGSYWLFEVQHPFNLWKQDYTFSAVYAHAVGFMKAGGYDFFRNISSYPQYALLDFAPTTLSVRFETSFMTGGHFVLAPFTEIVVNVSPYVNRNQIEWVLGLSYYFENSQTHLPKQLIY